MVPKTEVASSLVNLGSGIIYPKTPEYSDVRKSIGKDTPAQ